MFDRIIRNGSKVLGVVLGAVVAAGSAQAMDARSVGGLVTVKSMHSVAATADKLVAVLESKGMNVFARIDHAGGAAKVGQSLKPTQLVIFGNPKVGTPLMQCARTVAIDLPQKMLIWEADDGQVMLGYNSPQYLNGRHGLGKCEPVLKKVEGALANFAAAAAK